MGTQGQKIKANVSAVNYAAVAAKSSCLRHRIANAKTVKPEQIEFRSPFPPNRCNDMSYDRQSGTHASTHEIAAYARTFFGTRFQDEERERIQALPGDPTGPVWQGLRLLDHKGDDEDRE
jgi:hypothetical protein